jgi:hypothetical protein
MVLDVLRIIFLPFLLVMAFLLLDPVLSLTLLKGERFACFQDFVWK